MKKIIKTKNTEDSTMQNKCANGCPPDTDLRTCKTALAGQCPLLCKQGDTLIIGNRQQQLFQNTEDIS